MKTRKTRAVCLEKTAPARGPVEINPLLRAALDEAIAAMKKPARDGDALPLADPSEYMYIFEI